MEEALLQKKEDHRKRHTHGTTVPRYVQRGSAWTAPNTKALGNSTAASGAYIGRLGQRSNPTHSGRPSENIAQVGRVPGKDAAWLDVEHSKSNPGGEWGE
eukprot:EG_transcript_31409